MTLGRRAFLLTMSGAGAAFGLAGCAVPKGNGTADVVVLAPGFAGFAAALAHARTRAGAGLRTTLATRDGTLLDGWAADDHFRIVRTGAVKDGVWHLDTRGICMEFMLRMELLGPVASTPHPRPGRPWEPVLRVGDARRLMARMLAESGVEIRGVHGMPAYGPADFAVPGTDFVAGQRDGTALALAWRLGVPLSAGCPPAEFLDSEVVKARLARDSALPG